MQRSTVFRKKLRCCFSHESKYREKNPIFADYSKCYIYFARVRNFKMNFDSFVRLLNRKQSLNLTRTIKIYFPLYILICCYSNNTFFSFYRKLIDVQPQMEISSNLIVY